MYDLALENEVSLVNSKSVIMDADIAQESLSYIKAGILQEFSNVLFAQSNNIHHEHMMGLIKGIS